MGAILQLYVGAFHVGSQFFGEEVLPVTVGDVSCSGSEARLLDCSYSTDVTCQTERNDAGVVCQGINFTIVITSMRVRVSCISNIQKAK